MWILCSFFSWSNTHTLSLFTLKRALILSHTHSHTLTHTHTHSHTLTHTHTHSHTFPSRPIAHPLFRLRVFSLTGSGNVLEYPVRCETPERSSYFAVKRFFSSSCVIFGWGSTSWGNWASSFKKFDPTFTPPHTHTHPDTFAPSTPPRMLPLVETKALTARPAQNVLVSL